MAHWRGIEPGDLQEVHKVNALEFDLIFRDSDSEVHSCCSDYIERCTTTGIAYSRCCGILHRKFWTQFEECNSHKLRSVMQKSEKAKVRRSEKFN